MNASDKTEEERELAVAKVKAEKAQEFKTRYWTLRKEIQNYFEVYDEDFEIKEVLESNLDEPGRIEYRIKWAEKDEQDKIEKARAQREYEEKLTNAINFLVAKGKVLGKDFTFANVFEKAKEIAQNDAP
jgi:hypothetical protein